MRTAERQPSTAAARRAPTRWSRASVEVRRNEIIEVTLDSLSEDGFANTTIKAVARRAGVTGGLVIHHFGDKDGLMQAVFRHMLRRLNANILVLLGLAQTPRQRVQAIIEGNLSPEQFNNLREGNAWLAFWGQVRYVDSLKRIQRVYQRRLLTNLRHDLRELVPGADVHRVAAMVAAMIDGIWLRAALSGWSEIDSSTARELVGSFVDSFIDPPSDDGAHAVDTVSVPARQVLSTTAPDTY